MSNKKKKPEMKTIDWDGDLIVKRLDENGKKWAFNLIEDEPISARQMTHILHRCLRIPIEEIAFMRLDFKEFPHHTEAHFGVTGQFLYGK